MSEESDAKCYLFILLHRKFVGKQIYSVFSSNINGIEEWIYEIFRFYIKNICFYNLINRMKKVDPLCSKSTIPFYDFEEG